jgi:FkbH-like protein
LKLARCYARLGNDAAALTWLARVVDAPSSFQAWTAAAALLANITADHRPSALRHVRVALAGSSTTAQLGALLRLAALREGVDLELFEGDYGQYMQDVLEPSSGLFGFEPGYVILAVHEGALQLPRFSDSPDADVTAEIERWTSLWRVITDRAQARVIQFNFVPRPEVALGHLSTRLPGSRDAMIRALNRQLGLAARDEVLLVDCERLAAWFGTARWFDDRYWYLAKQAVALDALPLLARHTVAVLAASLGLSKKCLVLDLDNTLWGGVIGEDGLAGITLGAGPRGEAFVAFQEYLLELKHKGIVLAVASKNNEADARRVFTDHPDMRIHLEDLALFVCNWNDKASNLRTIAAALDLGVDALVLVDDNPAEAALVQQLLPEVDVVTLPADPSQYTRRLSEYLRLETSTLSAEDRSRTRHYQARAEAAELASAASGLDDFYRGLRMQAQIAPIDELHLPRIAQLIGKTNQFNLTTRRYQTEQLRALMSDPDVVHRFVKLRDRFADHGLISVLIARRQGQTLEIETWLMSCRVIGRTVEDALLARVCRVMQDLGCSILRGTYVPTGKNQLVRELYARFDFTMLDDQNGTTTWEYDIARQGPIRSDFIADWRVDDERA